MIAVIDYGMGNIHSLLKAISLFTDQFVFTDSVSEAEKCDTWILPGDGHFFKAMENLEKQNFLKALEKHTLENKKLLGICIGFQILFEDSDEVPKGKGAILKGLGFLKGNIRKFQPLPNQKVPHMGWNKITLPRKNSSVLLKDFRHDPYFYFIHSYRPTQTELQFSPGICRYLGEGFPAIVEKGSIFGTQFHPEKSSKSGLKVLENFLKHAGYVSHSSN